jgi:SprT protein
MLINHEQLLEVKNKVSEVVNKYNAIYKFGMKEPKIYYDISGTKAGVAKYATKTVHFNPQIAIKDWNEFITNTVPHEVCHLAVLHWALFNKKEIPSAHGATWKLMMWEVGAKPRRTHDIDVDDLKKKTSQYIYQCRCDEAVVVGVRIHNNIKNKFKSYACKRCGMKLKDGELKMSIGFPVDSPNGTTFTKKD